MRLGKVAAKAPVSTGRKDEMGEGYFWGILTLWTNRKNRWEKKQHGRAGVRDTGFLRGFHSRWWGDNQLPPLGKDQDHDLSKGHPALGLLNFRCKKGEKGTPG